MSRDDGQRQTGEPPEVLAPGTMTGVLQEIVQAPDEALGGGWEQVLRPGAVIGRFELVRELGRGGFGVVWEATDRELGRSVAFKAVRAGRKAAMREERLLREAEAAARLSHPNIITLFDVGRAEHGPYLVLELLHGQTLAERLGQGAISAHEAMRISIEVAKAVAYAHSQGVVHRDLKPENVFLCDDGQVKVLDFGLAHAFGHRRFAGGTPAYMAPEQQEEAPEDERTDVFALGVILFEMLAGTRPFPRGEAHAKAATLEIPEAPGLGEFIGRMLAKQPVERPRDGTEVLQALASFRGELERAPASASRPVRVRRSPLLRRVGLLGAGIAAGAVIAAGGAWWALHVRTTSAPPPSAPVTLCVLPLANLSGDASQEYFSDGMTDEIIGKLGHLRGLVVTARSSAAKYKGRALGAREIGKELGVAYLLEGSVRRDGDRIRVSATLVKTADAFQVWSESIDAKLDDIFDVQERVATRIVEALHVRLTADEAGSLGSWGTRNAKAYDEYLRGQVLVEHFHLLDKLEAARGHFDRALQMDPGFAPAMAGLASAEAQTYRNVDSRPERLERARALVERALSIDPRLTRALFASGEIEGAVDDYDGAAEKFRQVTAVEPRNYLAWDYLCWALGYVTPPKADEAEKACRRAIDINPAYGESYYHLARVLISEGRFDDAEQALRALAEHFPGSSLVSSGWFWFYLGSGRPRDAIVALERDEPIRRTNLGSAWKAMALARLGEQDRAFAALERALALGYRDLAALRGSPYFEPLRRDRRFATMLTKHGLQVTGGSPGAPAGAPSSAPAKGVTGRAPPR